MSDKCPFCKAGVSYLAEAGEYIRYYCGSVNYHGWSRSNNCYETQITHQADLLREAVEVVEEHARNHCKIIKVGNFVAEGGIVRMQGWLFGSPSNGEHDPVMTITGDNKVFIRGVEIVQWTAEYQEAHRVAAKQRTTEE